jgi:hypothetical protein
VSGGNGQRQPRHPVGNLIDRGFPRAILSRDEPVLYEEAQGCPNGFRMQQANAGSGGNSKVGDAVKAACASCDV